MSTQVLAGPPALDAAAVSAQGQPQDQIECAPRPAPAFLHSPPESNNTVKSDASDSELSDLDEEPILDDAPTLLADLQPKPDSESLPQEKAEPQPDAVQEEDIGDVLPDHWTNGVPVFKPTMAQFKDFNLFMRKVDSYGMKSGIIKIVPPEEWKAQQPELDNLVKQIKVREPIKQDIMGSNGTYRQVNILHGRSYNLPQWRQLCEQSEHQPPARRGERRANADKPKPTRSRQAAPKAANPSTPAKRRRGRPAKGKGKTGQKGEDKRPMTPVSPKPESEEIKEEPVQSIEEDLQPELDEEEPQPTVGRMGAIRPAKSKTQSTSARRKYSRREGSAVIDEAAFKDFDYRMDISDYTPERCEELERSYWKTLTYAPPLYGADLMGTLFDDRTESWNLNKLPNILDVLGTKVPGVNTAYLYLGMWKATFAWHLEDVDLYSINYLHFGAPKQWYSISQGDARRFEAAMKSIWPTDAKACDQFLRHKAFLISPQHLLQNFGIRVNKCLSYPGEFVVTYPYGYHSGYNLGYNCAEAVNFALDSWLDMGKIAKKCECAQAQDSVWINVYEIERKLRGEETEYEETEDEEEYEDGDEDDVMSGLPTPPASHGVKFKTPGRKRKRGPSDSEPKLKVKKIKLRLKTKAEPPCCLCPNDIPGMEVLPTDHGMKAHRICALYLPETYIDTVDGNETVFNVAAIHKDRLELKCLFCRSKRGACFQCSQKKCARAYHATCAAAAGLFVEEEEVPVFGEDGTEYKEQAFEFSCRFHRAKRDKKFDGDALEADERIRTAAQALKRGDVCQMQYHKGDIFAGLVVENRADEEMLLLDILPNGDRIEVEWKWLLLPDPSDYHLPKASSKALPLPTSRKAKEQLNAKRHEDDKPRKDDVFAEGFTWAEFHTQDVSNKEQAKVDLAKPDQVWFYLGKTSTDARAQYTDDPHKPYYNPKGNFLDTIPKPPKPVISKPPSQKLPKASAMPSYPYAGMGTLPTSAAISSRPEKPYIYKPKTPAQPSQASPSPYTPSTFVPTNMPGSLLSGYNAVARAAETNQNYLSQKFEPRPGPNQMVHQPALHNAPRPPNGPHSWHRTSNAGTPAVKQHVIQSALGSSYADRMSTQNSQQKKHTWQVYSSVYQKYPFFQVHHNREPSKYRTPYAPWGGFTNGYQGDLRAHLTTNHSDLLRRASMTASNPGTNFNNTYAASSPYSRIQPAGAGAPYPLTQASPTSVMPRPQQGTSLPPSQMQPTGNYPVHYQGHSHQSNLLSYNPQQQQQQQQQHLLAAKPKPKPVTTPKPYKVGLPAAFSLSLQSTKSTIQVPSKQSPVPLPANFLASMTSGPPTPASSKLSQHTQAEDNHVTEAVEQTATSTVATQALPVPAPQSAIPAAKPSTVPGKVSTTPVPLPRLPGMTPYQAAAQAHGAHPEETRPRSNPSDGPPSMNAQMGTSSLPPMNINPMGYQHNSESVTRIEESGPNRPLAASTTPTAPFPPSNIPAPSASTNDANIKVHGRESLADQTMLSTSNEPQEFPDVPGCESMEFVERMMQNLRRASQRTDSA